MLHSLLPYVMVLLIKKNSILLLKRADTSSFAPGHYSLPGGRVEKNETFRQALVRELQEELSIIVDQDKLDFKHVFYRNGVQHEGVAVVFECHEWQGTPINSEPDKHTEMHWFDIEQLPKPLIPAHENVLKLIKNKKYYSEQ